MSTSTEVSPVREKSVAEKALNGEKFEFGAFTYNPADRQLSCPTHNPVRMTKIHGAVLSRIAMSDIAGSHANTEALFSTMKIAGSGAVHTKVVHQTVHRIRSLLGKMSPGGDKHIKVTAGSYMLSMNKLGTGLRATKP